MASVSAGQVFHPGCCSHSIYIYMCVADEKAWLYTAAGKCLTTLPLRTLRKLAACHASLEATYSDISAAVCTAAQHHTQFFATTQRMTTEHPPALRESLAAVLTAAFGLRTDWLSHPLAMHGAARPPHERQRGCKWEGPGLVNVPHDDAAVAQALKWAILSTYTDSPTLLVCVLPTPAATASCQKFLAHPRLLPLAQMQGTESVWAGKH